MEDVDVVEPHRGAGLGVQLERRGVPGGIEETVRDVLPVSFGGLNNRPVGLLPHAGVPLLLTELCHSVLVTGTKEIHPTFHVVGVQRPGGGLGGVSPLVPEALSELCPRFLVQVVVDLPEVRQGCGAPPREGCLDAAEVDLPGYFGQEGHLDVVGDGEVHGDLGGVEDVRRALEGGAGRRASVCGAQIGVEGEEHRLEVLGGLDLKASEHDSPKV
mmetsp:Transcript_39444/g.77641  ORF Transcript_39444/g.77641 Transcript_39444/m.77641 type:complete len:215 (-) Transcript_39444:378-1022(-)